MFYVVCCNVAVFCVAILYVVVLYVAMLYVAKLLNVLFDASEGKRLQHSNKRRRMRKKKMVEWDIVVVCVVGVWWVCVVVCVVGVCGGCVWCVCGGWIAMENDWRNGGRVVWMV